MQPGKQPIEYLTSFEQIGNVTEFTRRRDEAVVHVESGEREYVIDMDVDPNSNKVRRMEVDRNFWGM
jgi:hypothetical protein